MPLGGTSNHFLYDYLRDEIGGWDAFNVTEDCDLGVWISRSNCQIDMMQSDTWEEANPDAKAWVNQRSRWIKGYMQTYFVHMRLFPGLLRDLGLRRFLKFQVVILSGFLLPMISPLFLMMTLFYILSIPLTTFVPSLDLSLSYIYLIHLHWVIPLGTGSFFIGNSIYVFILLMGHFRHPKPGYLRHILMFFWIYYWILMSWAALKALSEFVFNPFYWDKSSHDYVA